MSISLVTHFPAGLAMKTGYVFLTLLSFTSIAYADAPVFTEQPAPAREGEKCGTIQGIPCADGLWCDLRAGACKGADLDGVCVKPPDVCTEDYKPVCGCDGKTHSNDCKRIQTKAQKDHAGECKKDKGQTKPSKGR